MFDDILDNTYFPFQIFVPSDEMKHESGDNRISVEKGSGALLKDNVCQVSFLYIGL